MDLYPKNPSTLRRLLNKRQNPCTQIFKAQPLNSTNVPMSEMNLLQNNVSDQQLPNLLHQNSNLSTQSSNNFYQSQSHETLSTHSSSLNSPPQMETDEDDTHLLGKVQKKVKTSTFSSGNLEFQRKFSCEEEKDESEHSTACETRSDFNTSNENPEFLFSPPMSHINSREVPEMKLDGNDDTTIKSGIVHLDVNLLGDNFNRKGSEDLTHKVTESFSYAQREKCNLNHQCEMELGPNLKRVCPRCSVLLEECREFARKNDGVCLNEEYEEAIKYKCNKGHCWTLNYKNARRRWCAQCSKEQRAFMKKKCEADNIEREKQEEEYQRKLFEEARKKATTETSSKSAFNVSGNSGSENQKTMNTLEYFQKIDYEIESLAKKYTVEFMSHKAFAGDLTYQQILQVYKIMIMPEEILQTYMFNLNAEALRPEFRRMAKIIHPDKNKHPNAGNAFQKIYKVYEAALSRLEGTQQKI